MMNPARNAVSFVFVATVNMFCRRCKLHLIFQKFPLSAFVKLYQLHLHVQFRNGGANCVLLKLKSPYLKRANNFIRPKQYTYFPFSWNTRPWSSNCLFFYRQKTWWKRNMYDIFYNMQRDCRVQKLTHENANISLHTHKTACNGQQQNEILSAACSCFNLMVGNKYSCDDGIVTAYWRLPCNGTPLKLHAAVFRTVCDAKRLMLDLPGIFLLHFPRTFILRLLKSSCCWLTFKRRIKSHLPFAGIIRSSPYSPRFQDNC